MIQRKPANLLLSAAFLCLLVIVIPLWFAPYQISLATEIIIFALYAVSYNLLLGHAGLLSFGHAMFFGTGAYTTAIALNHIEGLPIYGAILFSVLSSTAVGLIFGGLLLRHKGSYFALLTLAFNALFYAVASKWSSITGGDDGLNITRPDLNLWFTTITMSDVTVFYFFTLICVGSLILFCWYFTHTAMGETVLLLRENEERMKFIGYNTHTTRLILFTFTGALAGFAGSFYALFFEFSSLSAISIDMTTTVLLMTFIGGTGTFGGPILGAVVFTYLQDFLSDITDRWPLIMGLIFIVMVLYVPRGTSGVISMLKTRLFTGIKKEGHGQIETREQQI
jgi:branched-chain amino acid transport system permease protein